MEPVCNTDLLLGRRSGKCQGEDRRRSKQSGRCGLMGINVPHYGIHGTPEAGEIGHSASHGCVRMTNWDATRVADLVKDGTPVVFEE